VQHELGLGLGGITLVEAGVVRQLALRVGQVLVGTQHGRAEA
jgi:hypothetical protein